MSRPLGIEYPNVWYHVMNRGAGYRNIFCNDSHRMLFLDLLLHNSGDTLFNYNKQKSQSLQLYRSSAPAARNRPQDNENRCFLLLIRHKFCEFLIVCQCV